MLDVSSPVVRDRAVGRPELPRGRAWAALVALVALGVGVPVVLAVARGAWSVPMEDDWAYVRDAFTLHDQHVFAFQGVGEMSRVGMLVLAQPFLWVFGDSIGALHAFGALSSAVFVLASYATVARLAGRRRGLGAAAVLALTPELPGVATTYMTDMPMLAATALSVAAGVRALQAVGRARWLWLSASMLAGFVAFSIREVGIAAPGAVIVVIAVQAYRRSEPTWPKALAPALVVVGGAVALVFEAWRHSLPGDQPAASPPGVLSPFVPVAWTAATLGALAFPVLVGLLVAGRLRLSYGPVALAVLGLIVLDVVFGAKQGLLPLPGADLLDPRGASTDPTLLGHPPATLFWILVVLQVPGTIGALLLVGHLDARLATQRAARSVPRPPELLLLWVLLPLVVVIEQPMMWTQWLDRYVLSIVWALVLLVLAAAPDLAWPRRAVVAAGLVVAVTGPLGWLLADEGFRVHAVTWQTGERLVALGYAPTDVDAGVEWTGFHSPVPGDPAKFTKGSDGLPDYLRTFTHRPCVFLTARRDATFGHQLLTTYPWTDTFGGHHELYVWELAGCPGSPLTPAS